MKRVSLALLRAQISSFRIETRSRLAMRLVPRVAGVGRVDASRSSAESPLARLHVPDLRRHVRVRPLRPRRHWFSRRRPVRRKKKSVQIPSKFSSNSVQIPQVASSSSSGARPWHAVTPRSRRAPAPPQSFETPCKGGEKSPFLARSRSESAHRAVLRELDAFRSIELETLRPTVSTFFSKTQRTFQRTWGPFALSRPDRSLKSRGCSESVRHSVF